MRTLLFSHLYPNSRFSVRGIFNLSRARALKERGCDVRVVAPMTLNPHIINIFDIKKLIDQYELVKKVLSVSSLEKTNGIVSYHPKWFKLPNKYFYRYHANILHLFSGKKIESIIEDYKPDLIISTWLNPFAVYAKYLSKYDQIKKFALAEGSDVLLDIHNYKGWPNLERSINDNCDIIIVVSKSMMEKVKDTTNLKNIKLVRNGFDDSLFNLKMSVKKEDISELRLLNVGNFLPSKGHDLLLKSVKNLHFKYRLSLIGTGPLLAKFKDYVSKNGLKGNVRFLGEIPHQKLPEIIRSHDLFCMPSRTEGLPAAPLEAMGCGLPVVAFNVGGINEIVLDNFNGYLCEADSVEDLTYKITLAASKNWDSSSISNWVTSNFGWNRWANQIVELYKNTPNSQV